MAEVDRSEASGFPIVIVLVAVAGLIAAGFLFARFFVFGFYSIPTLSMEPTLHKGDLAIFEQLPFAPAFRRGDVVSFRLPATPKSIYIKRLIGLPGDRIQMKNGQLYINGSPLKEAPADLPRSPAKTEEPEDVKGLLETTPEGRSYLIQVYPPADREEADTPGGPTPNDTIAYVVPANCYFVLGDNRDNALDIRFDAQLSDGDPRLGGCGQSHGLPSNPGNPGVGFLPKANLLGVLVWDSSSATAQKAHP